MTQLRSHPRLIRKLQEALGDQLCVALDDANVVEIMLNPDGRLFIERLGHGVAPAGQMAAATAEIADTAPDDRILILEDTAELQCPAENLVALHTSDTVDMARLLKSTMRLRPDRIIVGEVRDGAALTLLKAWNTGHPGGVTTIHSNTAMSALRRLEQLTAEVSQQPMQEVIGEAVDLIVSI